MTPEQIQSILASHKLWLAGEGGERADFSGADLRWADFSKADLREANLSKVDLRAVDLSDADLSDADLSDAALSYANLSRSNLSKAILSRADLRNTDLSDADLNEAILTEVDLSKAILSRADLSKAILMVLHLPIWNVFVCRTTVRIGCQHYTHDEWRGFSDEQIDLMHIRALQWWTTHKSLIFAAMDAVASQPEQSRISKKTISCG